ncbi:hypothetical protein A4S06_11595 [Erysipelotrichaceae bacterium MTC7]|nr:hypothetical protein A4S06_11595 [Erysipelotrichaceae bacterium MTC7]
MFTTWGTISVIFFSSLSIYFLKQLKDRYANQQIDIKPLLIIFVVISLRLAIPIELPIIGHFLSTNVLVLLSKMLRTKILMDYMILDLMIFFWFTISAYKLIKLIRKTYVTNRVFSIFPSSEIPQSIMPSLVDFMPKRRKIRVIYVNFVPAPMVIGLVKGTIIIPKDDYTEAELSMILQHELTHFLHFHMLIKLLIEFIYALYWWNPLLFVIRRQTYELLEKDVDLHVLKMKENNSVTYTEFLFKMYRKAETYGINSNIIWNKTPLISEFAGNESNSEFTTRCRSILSFDENSKRTKLNNLSYTLLLILIVMVSLVTFQPDYPIPEGNEYFILTEDNSYIIETDKGFDVYYKNEYLETIEEITVEYEHLEVKSE